VEVTRAELSMSIHYDVEDADPEVSQPSRNTRGGPRSAETRLIKRDSA
jgi:hypothetical protein